MTDPRHDTKRRQPAREAQPQSEPAGATAARLALLCGGVACGLALILPAGTSNLILLGISAACVILRFLVTSGAPLRNRVNRTDPGRLPPPSSMFDP